MEGLTPKQQAFVQAYLGGATATAAYRKAYPAVKTDDTAGVNASRLLGNAKVAAAIRKAADGAGLSAERSLREVAALAHSCVSHYEIGDDGNVLLAPGAPPDAMRAVASIKKKVRHVGGEVTERETEIKLWDKPSSLRMALQHQGLLNEAAAGPPPQPVTYIEVRITANAAAAAGTGAPAV